MSKEPTSKKHYLEAYIQTCGFGVILGGICGWSLGKKRTNLAALYKTPFDMSVIGPNSGNVIYNAYSFRAQNQRGRISNVTDAKLEDVRIRKNLCRSFFVGVSIGCLISYIGR